MELGLVCFIIPLMVRMGVDSLVTRHNCIKGSSDMPAFYGKASKDFFAAIDYLECSEKSARISKWTTSERRTDYFFTQYFKEDAHER